MFANKKACYAIEISTSYGTPCQPQYCCIQSLKKSSKIVYKDSIIAKERIVANSAESNTNKLAAFRFVIR